MAVASQSSYIYPALQTHIRARANDRCVDAAKTIPSMEAAHTGHVTPTEMHAHPFSSAAARRSKQVVPHNTSPRDTHNVFSDLVEGICDRHVPAKGGACALRDRIEEVDTVVLRQQRPAYSAQTHYVSCVAFVY